MPKKPLEYGAPCTLVAIGLGLVFVISNANPAEMERYQQRFLAYVETLQDQITTVDEDTVVVAVAPRAKALPTEPTAFATAFALSTVRPPLSTYAPSAPEGWTVRASEAGDYQAMTSVAPINWAEVNPSIAEVERTMANHIMVHIGARTRDRGFEHTTVTYQSGTKMIMLDMRFVPSAVLDGSSGVEFNLLQDMMRELCATEYDVGVFTSVQGVPFDESVIKGSSNGRRFVGFIGPQIDIELWTNADDADVMAILSQLDATGLNMMLRQPVPAIGGEPV